MKKKQDLFFEDITEMCIWKEFVRYNRVKYTFLYILGLLSGIIISTIFFMVV